MSKRRPKTCGKPGARTRRIAALAPERRSSYERKLARDRERLRRIYHERRALVDRWHDGKCAACGQPVTAEERDLDHVDCSLKRLKSTQPHRTGWLEEARENMQPLCVGCHIEKNRADRAKKAARYIEREQDSRDSPPPF